jgi:hypothetical protein
LELNISNISDYTIWSPQERVRQYPMFKIAFLCMICTLIDHQD